MSQNLEVAIKAVEAELVERKKEIDRLEKIKAAMENMLPKKEEGK